MKNERTKADTINDIAWQEFVKADKTPFEATVYDQIRPAFTPTSPTEAAAREMVDASQAFAGMPGHLSELVDEIDPATYRESKAHAYRAAQGDQTAGGRK
jgi:hypothetical protein